MGMGDEVDIKETEAELDEFGVEISPDALEEILGDEESAEDEDTAESAEEDDEDPDYVAYDSFDDADAF